MVTAPQEVGEAEVTAGIFAATGDLLADLTVDRIAARLEAVRGSISFWAGGGSPAGSPVARFAGWRRPEPSVLTVRLHRALAEGFVRTFPPASPPPVTFLRLEVGTLEESTVLSGARTQGVRVVPHLRIGTTGAQRPLRSPLRVGATGESGVDVVVVEAGDGRALGGVIAPVAVIVGAPSEGVVHRLNRMVALGYGGIALVEDRRGDLAFRLGAALARGLPLDVALASCVAGDVVLVVDEAMLHTKSPVASTPSASPPSAAQSAAPAPTTWGPEPRSSRRFRWPWQPKDDAPGESESVRDRGLTLDSDGAEPEPSGAEPAGAELEPARSEAAPDRRLQAEVRDDTGSERRDGFAAGRRHELRIRIAAEGSDTVISADRAFTSPVVGKAVDLTIVVRTRGSTERPVRRTLRLPADGDTEWTNPIPIDVPAHAAEIAVELVVFHAGRTLQTAVLTGPVLAGDGHVGTGRLELSVDADVPNAAAPSRAPAAATLMLGGTAGAPQVVDLSELGRVIPPDRLASATKAVRGVLLDAFVNERPQNLAEAAGVLTKLAVRGATLHGALRGNADSFHDDDPWIHVVSFGASDVPLELVYAHPMPDRDDEVPVCDEALGGASECVRTCGGRTRSDRVCPFGFWGTSKVVERRLHVSGRVGVDAPAARRVSLTDAAVVGMSNKTDANDTGASGRIVKAVESAVARGACRRVMKWDELRDAVGVGTPGVIVLVTHTSKALDPDDDLGISLELGGDEQPVHRIDKSFVNPGPRHPGPIVISLGCDTRHLDVGFSDWVGVLHAARAELVVSTISPVPGKDVADLVERLFSLVPELLRGPGPYRFGELLTVVRRALIAEGDVLALAITASGDGDVELSGGASPGRSPGLTMLTVEMLAARYGDSLLVTWGAPGDEHRMLIDAGLAGAYPAIKARLGELDCDIDLLVVTHVDIDHVGGAVKLLADDEVAQRVAGVWFNGYVHLEQFSDILGALDGERLTALIRARAMTWNKGWPDAPNDECGGAIVVRDVPPVVELGGGATITLLSPTPDKLCRLHDVWLEAITKAGLVDGTDGVRDEAEADRIADLLGSLADLADVRSDPDDAEANGSSIAFVFEHEGVRILFGGDAHSDALLGSLAHLAPEGERYRVDACKLPHHGSRRNVSSAFVARLDCSYWWFSSNGVRFHHPNDEAIARVIRYGSPGARLAGNYRSDRWAAFIAAHPPGENGYALELPDEGCEGLMITLDPPARAAGAPPDR